MTSAPKTVLHLLEEVDNFPYNNEANPTIYSGLISSFYKFWLHNSESCVGWIHPWVKQKMPFGENWSVDEVTKIIRPCRAILLFGEQQFVIAQTLEEARDKKIFQVVSGKGWRNEHYPIYGLYGTQIGIERGGAPLFGMVTCGVHCTAYIETKAGLKIWTPRRARNRPTHPGMLDNPIAGGMAFGDGAFTTLVKESNEEADLPEDLGRKYAKSCGTVSYFHVQAKRDGEESGLLQPTVQYVYDLNLPESMLLHPKDDEVESFELLTVGQVRKALANGEFRPSSVMVLLDFLIRHGFITAENEPNFAEIVSRLHRRLPFPVSLGSA
jgi:hypothetical protein